MSASARTGTRRTSPKKDPPLGGSSWFAYPFLAIAAAAVRATTRGGPGVRIFELRLVCERVTRREVFAVAPAVVAARAAATSTSPYLLHADVQRRLDCRLARIAERRLRQHAEMLQGTGYREPERREG